MEFVTPGRSGERRTATCLCDCGKTVVVDVKNLRRGNTRSCGCLRAESQKGKNATHGMSGTGDRTYSSWRSMRDRCNNPSSSKFHLYGGRGITVCEQWDDFLVFLADMGERPDATSIDRINPDLGYSKTNCRWASIVVQNNNSRTNHVLTAGGKSLTITQWARDTGISIESIRARLRRGWTEESAVLTPKMSRHRAGTATPKNAKARGEASSGVTALAAA